MTDLNSDIEEVIKNLKLSEKKSLFSMMKKKMALINLIHSPELNLLD
jgi:hypothetical protein